MSAPEPEPISPDNLPPTPAPEYQYHTVLGGASGCMLWPGEQPGRVVVKRLVTYGEWEPATPARWKPESEAERLAGIGKFAKRILLTTSVPRVSAIAWIIEQLATGAISVREAHQKLGET